MLSTFSAFSQTVTNTITLDGSASFDPDGTIVSYSWKQISGPAASVIANAQSVKTAVTYTVSGVYSYELTVTDNDGAIGKDTVTETVNKGNIIPKANAGQNQTIRLPASTAMLQGSGQGTDVKWTQIDGPKKTTIKTPTAWVSKVEGLDQKGSYTYKLAVDNTAYDFTSVTVDKAKFNLFNFLFGWLFNLIA